MENPQSDETVVQFSNRSGDGHEDAKESLRFIVSDSIDEFLALFERASLSPERVMDRYFEQSSASGRSQNYGK